MVTVLLLAFLVLLLVSLAALTRVETEIAGNADKLARARHTAMMALNLAIGELQRTTGADQRVTVTADIGTVGDSDAATLDNGLPTATDGTYAWTGVIGNSANPINPLDARKAAHTGETPAVLNWLVSGNENVAFSVSTIGESFGQVTAAPPATGVGSIHFGPGSAVGGLSAAATINDPLTITPSGGAARAAVMLVGPGSAANSVDAAAPQANYVVAPLMDIGVPTSQIPGLGAAPGNTLVGRYAWWVGDEGVKARVNLDDPNKAITTGDNARLRTLVAARTGTEVLTGFGGIAPENPLTVLSRVVADGQFNLLPGVTATAAKARFHDATSFSAGVLTNVSTGGLKKDLAAGLLGSTQPDEIKDSEQLFTTPGANPSTGTDNAAGAGRPFNQLTTANLTALRTPAWSVTGPATTSAASGPAAWPNWGKIRSYVQTKDLVASDGARVAPRTGTDSRMAIHPVVTRFQIFIVAFAENSGASSPGLRAAYMPAVVLWNPYDVTLSAADYGFYYEADYTQFSGTAASQVPTTWNIGAPYVSSGVPSWPSFVAVHSPGGRDDRYVFPGYPAITNPANPQSAEAWTNRRTLTGAKFVSERMGQRKGLRFVIRAGDIPPGEAVVFTPSSTAPLQEDPRQNIMTPGWRVSAFTERFSAGIPPGNQIRYVLGTWPVELCTNQRFSLGLGGTFRNGPAGVPQIPENLLQTVSDISSSGHAALDNDRSPHYTRFVDYTAYAEPFPGVNPLPDNGSASWVPPGALLVNNNTGPHSTRFVEWDPAGDGAEIDEIQVGNAIPPATALNFVFRMESALPHVDVRPYQAGSGGAAASARAMRWLGSLNPFSSRLGRSMVESSTGTNTSGGGYAANPLFAYPGILDYHGDNFITHHPTKFRIPTWDPDLSRAYVGSSTGRIVDPSNPVGNVEGSHRLIVRHLPRTANTTLSVGALQHADLHPTTGILHDPPANLAAAVPTGYAASHMPAQAVGNSLADPLVNAADVDGFPNNWNTITSTNLRSESRWLRAHFDLSLLANRALWDRYYFSGVDPSSATSSVSRNPRLALYDRNNLIASGDPAATAALRAFDTAAANQTVVGAFNINSTSREAWIAMLSSMRNAAVPGFNTVPGQTPVLRVNGAVGDPFQTNIPNTGLPSHRIQESDRFRALTDTQIAALADQIVDEIRARGPALSLAGFVNRKPQAGGDAESADAVTRRQGLQRYLGPLQSAIDRVRSYDPVTGNVATYAGINDNLMREIILNTNTSSSNPVGYGRAPYSVNFSRMAAGAHREVTGAANGIGTTGSLFIIADAPLALRTRAFGMPGYLTQADILQALGPVLSARSDTFRIRTYGDVRNPITGETQARAWLEAVVQRVPEFVDETDSAEKWRPSDTSAAANTWNPATSHRTDNLVFGRRYKVVSFRWLSPSDV